MNKLILGLIVILAVICSTPVSMALDVVSCHSMEAHIRMSQLSMTDGYDEFESTEALTIAFGMFRDGESCGAIYDFLQDTALEHTIDDFGLGCD